MTAPQHPLYGRWLEEQIKEYGKEYANVLQGRQAP